METELLVSNRHRLWPLAFPKQLDHKDATVVFRDSARTYLCLPLFVTTVASLVTNF